ncbi:MAG: hypothetical protein Q8930_19920 [Bacillota bacterium]|nr:hypothetical protein [Bacillota bacterium]
MKKMMKIMMALALVVSIHSMPVFGLNIKDNNVDIKDTFRMYIINPVKI